jgi:putative transposase
MPRIARVVALGLPHHVTQRGNNRGQVFFDDDDRRFYLLTLAKYRQQYGVEVWGYCLMGNHVHVLAVPEREESLARCFAGTNLVYTQYINRKMSRSGRLWQNRFFSCPVDKDSYLWPVLRYIERNPVRVGKVKQARQYEWSSARRHVKGEPDAVVNEPDWFAGELRAMKYGRFLREEPEDTTFEIRRMTATGRPLGTPEFRVALETDLGRNLGPKKGGRPRRGWNNMGSVPPWPSVALHC